MPDVPFTLGLPRVAPGTYAYLQPRGSWGQRNAGLSVDGQQSLLIDDMIELFGAMARWEREQRRRRGGPSAGRARP